MFIFLLATLGNAAHVESASTLVRAREQELNGTLAASKAMELIQLNSEVPALVTELIQARKVVRRHGSSLLSVAEDKEPDADTLKKLDQARVILNKMYSANQVELDIVIWDCREYTHSQISLMDENTRLRTMMGAAAARAKGLQLEANAGIKEAHGELEELNAALQKHQEGCDLTLGALRQQEAILANDYEVSMMIQNATEASCDKPAGAALVQCHMGKGGASYDFAPDFKANIASAKFRSKVARDAMERLEHLALQRHEAHDQERQGMVLEGLLQSRAQMRARRMREDPPAPAPAPISAAHSEAAELSDRPKCSTDNADCGLLFDQVATMVSAILADLQELREQIATTEAHCQQVASDYEGQISEWEGILDEDQVKLAQAIEVENTNSESLRQKIIEYTALNEEYMAKKEECDAKKTELVNTLCGIKVVRTEVYHAEEVYDVMITDCEVGDWVNQECSVTCGGGSQLVTRDIISPETMGAECPPVSEEQNCNDQACPIDCTMEDWSEWTSCSKDCGGGVKQKTRGVRIEAKNGGLACEATDDAEMCNMGACDVDCVLAMWGEWGPCSKECDGGINMRRKEILEPLAGMGHCADEFSPDRFEEHICNEATCPPNLVCNSKVDIVLMLDGSGSVRPNGFQQTKRFAHNLVQRLHMGELTAKVGLIRFSSKIDVLEQMTFDKAGLLATIDGMSFPSRSTQTAMALGAALDVLNAGGRKDVSKENTIVFVLTDGRPCNAKKTERMAHKVRDNARLVFVPVGRGMGQAGLDAMLSWASFPPEENTLQAPSYEALAGVVKSVIPDLCSSVMCSEEYAEADMSDYMGCQSVTVEGLGCQKWTAQHPNEHEHGPNGEGAWPAELQDRGLQGGHNYCRNPDGKPGGIWCYTTSTESPWEYCAPRPANATGW